MGGKAALALLMVARATRAHEEVLVVRRPFTKQPPLSPQPPLPLNAATHAAAFDDASVAVLDDGGRLWRVAETGEATPLGAGYRRPRGNRVRWSWMSSVLREDDASSPTLQK